MNEKSYTHTYYNIESFDWYEPGNGQDGWWRQVSGGGGHLTISAAHIRLKEYLERAIGNKCDLSKVKFKIKKIVTIQSDEEEYADSDFTAFMLKTA